MHATPRPDLRLRTLAALAYRLRLAPIALALVGLLAPALARAGDVAATEPNVFTSFLDRWGLLGGALGAFAGGLGASLMPCTYPMIAITVSVFGAREAKSRREAMLLSTSFVCGLVTLFTPMIVAAALSGSVFGTALSNKWVTFGLYTFFMAMAASMFGAFDLTLPDALTQRLSSAGGIGYRGAFVLGMVGGIMGAPCTGPVLLTILGWIAKTQSVALGTVVGLSFSLGLGMLFWVVGTFAVSLPKGGKWMLGIKSAAGIVMVVMAHSYLKNALPAIARPARPDTAFLATCAAVVAAGLAVGALHLAWDDGGVVVKARKALGLLLCSVGGFFLYVGWDMPKASLTWEHSEEVAAAKARTEKRPLLVDFTAEWCPSCKELSKETFSDPRVMAKAVAANFVAVKVDATNDDDPQVDAVKGKYRVVGLPTVVIYDSTGRERKRFNEFVGPEPFLAAIEGVQ
jgi:thiol:disulfide interchange protein DsbD